MNKTLILCIFFSSLLSLNVSALPEKHLKIDRCWDLMNQLPSTIKGILFPHRICINSITIQRGLKSNALISGYYLSHKKIEYFDDVKFRIKVLRDWDGDFYAKSIVLLHESGISTNSSHSYQIGKVTSILRLNFLHNGRVWPEGVIRTKQRNLVVWSSHYQRKR